jgi:hypothetical protein
MIARLLQVVAMLGVMGISVVGSPAVAGAAGACTIGAACATLYELTENMKVVKKHQRNNPVGHRVATSALTGVANPGTPLCPYEKYQSGPAGCAVNVLGNDNVSLSDGYGTLSGRFTTVTDGDNPVDGPEAVALKGTFNGQMDFSPAIVLQIPYGTVVGKVRTEQGRKTEFTGIFRLPFVGSVLREVEVAPGVTVTLTLRQLLCPATPNPNPYTDRYKALYKELYPEDFDFDFAYLDNVEAVTTAAGKCLDIQPHELSLGTPLVRFDIDF